MLTIERSGNSYSYRPAGPPRSRKGKLARLVGLVEERLAIAGGVTRDGLIEAGIPAEDLDDLAPDVRQALAARGLSAGW